EVGEVRVLERIGRRLVELRRIVPPDEEDHRPTVELHARVSRGWGAGTSGRGGRPRRLDAGDPGLHPGLEQPERERPLLENAVVEPTDIEPVAQRLLRPGWHLSELELSHLVG